MKLLLSQNFRSRRPRRSWIQGIRPSMSSKRCLGIDNCNESDI